MVNYVPVVARGLECQLQRTADASRKAGTCDTKRALGCVAGPDSMLPANARESGTACIEANAVPTILGSIPGLVS
jgi:hypothetical protein